MAHHSTGRGASGFGSTPAPRYPRSVFDRSHNLKTAFNEGALIPIFVDECSPGDTIRCSVRSYVRQTTPICPVLDNAYIEYEAFFVPWRIVWKNWPKLMGERKRPKDSIDYLCPVVRSGASGFDFESIYDYMGLPPKVPNLEVNELYLRAYCKCYDDWYRDENLQDSIDFTDGDESHDASAFRLLPIGKKPDYFTSALPWPQKGGNITFNIGGQAPLAARQPRQDLFLDTPLVKGSGDPSNLRPLRGDLTNNIHTVRYSNPDSGNESIASLSGSISASGLASNYYADLSQASLFTINQLRTAVVLQQLGELDARSGTRYVEVLRAHFGVSNEDYRLQRSELIADGSQTINYFSVAQTSSTDSTSPQGNVGAVALTQGQPLYFRYNAREHGCILVLAHIRADLTYQQGLAKMWSRRARYDFLDPRLANIGEQPILRKEIFATGNPAEDNAIFGYQEQYADYRTAQSRITGKMRSQYPQSLDRWHFAEYFKTAPVLSGAFIEHHPPFERSSAVPSEPHFFGDFHFKISHARELPVFSVPGLRRL